MLNICLSRRPTTGLVVFREKLSVGIFVDTVSTRPFKLYLGSFAFFLFFPLTMSLREELTFSGNIFR